MKIIYHLRNDNRSTTITEALQYSIRRAWLQDFEEYEGQTQLKLEVSEFNDDATAEACDRRTSRTKGGVCAVSSWLVALKIPLLGIVPQS